MEQTWPKPTLTSIFGKAETNPLRLAVAAGTSVYRRPGEIWLPELELTYICQVLGHARCDELKAGDQRSPVRVRRHLTLVGPKGSCKTSMSKYFLERLIGAVEYGQVARGDTSRPTFAVVDGGGSSWEKRRGGAVEGNLVFPSLHEITFLWSGELASFLGGAGERVRRMMEVLNPALEEGIICVEQLGMANVKKNKKEAFAGMCEGTPVRYNMEKDSMSYDAAFSLISSTRPMDTGKAKETWGILDDSGFLSRIHISEWRPSEEALNEYALDKHGNRNIVAETQLLNFNRYAWLCKFKFVPAPPLAMVNELVAHYHEVYSEASKDTGTPISELRSDRDYSDICQLIMAFAAIRTIETAWVAGLPPQVFDELRYEMQDVEAIKKFRTYHMDMVNRRAIAQAKEDKLRDKVHDTLIAHLRKLMWEIESDIVPIERPSLAKFIMLADNVSKPTAYNRIDKMLTCGFIEPLDKKKYKVAPGIIADMGIEVEPEPEHDPDRSTLDDLEHMDLGDDDELEVKYDG